MQVLTPFDPWKSKLCTCPPKYSFNPYTGCAHNCLYCYATYIPRFWELREKKNLFQRLKKELESLPSDALISMSNSSDPYPPIENERMITRRCLEMMNEYDIRVLVVTKSDIVSRDIDLLSEMRTAVSITITGKIAGRLERNAPPTEKRIQALKELKNAGVPVILRLDPILPWADHREWLKLLEKCDFVDHVVTSTLKLKRDAYSRLIRGFPELRPILEKLYLREGETFGGYLSLSKKCREEMLKIIADKCEEIAIIYGFCREGISFRSGSCDGSHLIH
jgi:DNA repair photolyase